MKKHYAIAILFCIGQIGWSQSAFYPTENVSGQQFGSAVAVAGNEIIVSSRSRTFFPIEQGKVFLFEQNGSTITQTDVFLPADVLITDDFGASVSIDNNFIAIGAPQHNNTGATYMYTKNGTEWQLTQEIVAPEPNVGAEFGRAVISGNYLFISAIADETGSEDPDSDSGLVYIYTYSGTQWTFLQAWSASSYHFGDQIRVVGDTLLISSIGTSLSKIFHHFTLVDGLWLAAGASPEFGSLEESVSDFQISDGKLFLISRSEAAQQIKVIDYTTWATLNTIAIAQTDQIFTSLAISGDRMFLGSSSYILQMQRKFPVLYYRKIADEWQYQNSLYGTASGSTDDYFGQTLAIDGNQLLIGAPLEGSALPTGKAYYLDIQTLASPSFEKASAVLYPNPVSDSFEIRSDGIGKPEKIELFSVNGLLLQTYRSPQAAVDVTSLSSGIYFAKVTDQNENRQTFKFIKK